MEPDIDGFVAAQRELRDAFGEEIVFTGSVTVTWPVDTEIDPETGEPYDPLIEPVSSGSPQTATVKCNVAFRTAPTTAGAEFAAFGAVENDHVMLIADIDDQSTIEPMTDFTCRGARFKIESKRPDGVGGVQRFLVYGRRR